MHFNLNEKNICLKYLEKSHESAYLCAPLRKGNEFKQHFFKMRDMPLVIHRITGKSASNMVIYTSKSHFLYICDLIKGIRCKNQTRLLIVFGCNKFFLKNITLLIKILANCLSKSINSKNLIAALKVSFDTNAFCF